MDQLPPLGTAISSVVPGTFATYNPLLQPQSTHITSTSHKTFRYGTHPRQELDVYYPSQPHPNTPSPRPQVLIFLHGGGLIRGAKNLSPLIYANVGHFFTSRGITTIIPNYRLIEHGARFPSGGEDIALIITWLSQNLASISDAAHTHGITLSMMGNSAGGLHLATYLLGEEFARSRHDVTSEHNSQRRIWLEKIVFLATPFDMQDALPERKAVNDAYFGDRVVENSPLGLLRSAQKPFQGLNVLVLTGSLDPEDEILASNGRFVDECKRRGLGGGSLKVEVMEGHNHISPVLALGTGIEKEESWGKGVAEFTVS